MCLGIPVQILETDGMVALVELGGTRRQISVMLLEEIKVDDWVICHAGFAIHKIDEQEAKETLELLAQLPEAGEIVV